MSGQFGEKSEIFRKKPVILAGKCSERKNSVVTSDKICFLGIFRGLLRKILLWFLEFKGIIFEISSVILAAAASFRKKLRMTACRGFYREHLSLRNICGKVRALGAHSRN